MSFLAVAVATACVFCILNLLLTLGVIRRLREYSELLSMLTPSPLPVTGLADAEPVGAFAAVTVDGELLPGASGLRVAAFFSSACSICPERVGPFVDYLTRNHVPRSEALSVVVSPDGDSPPYLDRLARCSQVCREGFEGEMARAFKIAGFPAFCLLDSEGELLVASYDPATLPEPVVRQ